MLTSRLVGQLEDCVPTYEYSCKECDTNHEIVQSMVDPTLTTCPACGKESLRKQFSGVGVMFKGSGFYRTDSRSTDSSTSTSTPKTETTPAATPAAEKSAPKKTESSSGSGATS
ncbi:MAG: zinc ribbon domain-containing protein [Candidatus Nanopelagicales bacterium]